MKTVIITGGTIQKAFANEYIKKLKPDYVIAADAGMEFLYDNNRIPNCIVGDFDSVDAEILAYFHSKPEIIWKVFCPEKDETDTELAIMTALEHGSTEIHILGGTGTRLDHVIGNIQLLFKALERGVQCFIVDVNNRIRLIDGKTIIRKKEQYGKYVSILPLTSFVHDITLKGFKYPLYKATLQSDNTLGISNEIVDDKAEINFEEGIAILIESRD